MIVHTVTCLNLATIPTVRVEVFASETLARDWANGYANSRGYPYQRIRFSQNMIEIWEGYTLADIITIGGNHVNV